MNKREFHISKASRKKYDFDEGLFALNGNVIIADFHAARIFAHRLNKHRDLIRHPEKAVRPGLINAAGLTDEVYHFVFKLYREQSSPECLAKAEEALTKKLGKKEFNKLLEAFVDEFPPLDVQRGKTSKEEYLEGKTGSERNREITMEELIMLKISNENPALSNISELFDEKNLRKNTKYNEAFSILDEFFDDLPAFGPGGISLLKLFRAPIKAHPASIMDQLNYIRDRWGSFVGRYLFRILSSFDLIREDEKEFGLGGPGPVEVYEYGGLDEEAERFSLDQEWMPRVVLLAKSTLVWLDQLSKSYGRPIKRLDEIPDQELDLIASRGFNALWLIGLWERSSASKRIKHLCGNPEAEASAYSLLGYEIASQIGGWDALTNLKERCFSRGIVLASDMVPNHTGIDSDWVEQHPDWFISVGEPPYPGYSFNGENLSRNPGIGIQIEDHYYDKTDAAVVFKRHDYGSGDVRYIYHGNDGTSMPWNDTAQLNFLNPETREAVIQTIIHVARNFPVIRFDAAMTLAKKHYRRLWFPEPGSGGDIPSRAEHGMTKEEFDRAMPVEFWREVVDRVAEEAPDTLLLAEAFWMMEGYFVRSLGMHRVYNSAFMNMLKNQENQKYRNTIKNTLEFDPEILKRFVNFMNNPDEETALAQFGKGDKYFGIATMMVTMPGLPMFGHGQIEGFTEKYGMEYSRAYMDEQADEELVRRHEREIFPLLKKRYLYAGVDNFCLFDLYSDFGGVNEDVFIYTNSSGFESSLVLYNNAYESARGWVRLSSASKNKANGNLEQKDLGQALGLHAKLGYFLLLREQRSGLWYIRNSKDICDRGLYVELGGYQCQVFTDVHEVQDDEFFHYSKLHDRLEGAGTPDLDHALKEIYYTPLLSHFDLAVNAESINVLKETALGNPVGAEKMDQLIYEPMISFLKEAKNYTEDEWEADLVLEGLAERLQSLYTVSRLASRPASEIPTSVPTAAEALQWFQSGLEEEGAYGPVFLLWVLLGSLEVIELDDWLTERQVEKALGPIFDPFGLHKGLQVYRVLSSWSDWYRMPDFGLGDLFRYGPAKDFLEVNRHDDKLWFHKESFEEVQWMLFAAACINEAENYLSGIQSAKPAGGAGGPIAGRVREGGAGRQTGRGASSGRAPDSSVDTTAGAGGPGSAGKEAADSPRRPTGAAAASPTEAEKEFLATISSAYERVQAWLSLMERSGYQVEKLLSLSGT